MPPLPFLLLLLLRLLLLLPARSSRRDALRRRRCVREPASPCAGLQRLRASTSSRGSGGSTDTARRRLSGRSAAGPAHRPPRCPPSAAAGRLPRTARRGSPRPAQPPRARAAPAPRGGGGCRRGRGGRRCPFPGPALCAAPLGPRAPLLAGAETAEGIRSPLLGDTFRQRVLKFRTRVWCSRPCTEHHHRLPSRGRHLPGPLRRGSGGAAAARESRGRLSVSRL